MDGAALWLLKPEVFEYALQRVRRYVSRLINGAMVVR